MKQYSDIRGILQCFKINWNKVDGNIIWFPKMAPKLYFSFTHVAKYWNHFMIWIIIQSIFIWKEIYINWIVMRITWHNLQCYIIQLFFTTKENIKIANDTIHDTQNILIIDVEWLLVQNKEYEITFVELVGKLGEYTNNIAESVILDTL